MVPVPRSAATARDQALARLRRLNRGIVAGTVLLIALLSDVAAQALPGHTITRAATPTTAKAKRSPPRHPAVHDKTATAPAAATDQAPPPTVQTPTPPAATPTYQPPAPQAPAPPPQAPVSTPAPAQTTSGGS